MKILKKIYLLFLIIVGVSVFCYNAYNDQKEKRNFIKSSYNGIIYDIQFIKYQHGDMNIKINNSWHRTGIWENKIGKYIKIGDSIVKLPGVKDIYVYRKDTIIKKWKLKIFKNIFL